MVDDYNIIQIHFTFVLNQWLKYNGLVHESYQIEMVSSNDYNVL